VKSETDEMHAQSLRVEAKAMIRGKESVGNEAGMLRRAAHSTLDISSFCFCLRLPIRKAGYCALFFVVVPRNTLFKSLVTLLCDVKY
jgi:hypothetical protein